MTTKLDIGDNVKIGANTYAIKKIIIDKYRTKYLVGTTIYPLLNHLCSDEFTDDDIDNGIVKKI